MHIWRKKVHVKTGAYLKEKSSRLARHPVQIGSSLFQLTISISSKTHFLTNFPLILYPSLHWKKKLLLKKLYFVQLTCPFVILNSPHWRT